MTPDNVNRRALMQTMSAVGIGSFLLHDGAIAHQSPSLEATPIANPRATPTSILDTYESTWLGVPVKLRVSSSWILTEDETYGLKTLRFDGDDATRIVIYFEQGIGVTPQIIADARKSGMENVRARIPQITFEDVIEADISSGRGNDARLIRGMVLGENLGTLEHFLGQYFTVYRANGAPSLVLCVEFSSLVSGETITQQGTRLSLLIDSLTVPGLAPTPPE